MFAYLSLLWVGSLLRRFYWVLLDTIAITSDLELRSEKEIERDCLPNCLRNNLRTINCSRSRSDKNDEVDESFE